MKQFAIRLFGIALVYMAGCAAVTREGRQSTLDMSLQKATVDKPSVRFWISESTVTGGDGLRNAGVISIASELADLVNQAYVNRLRSAPVAANAFELAVPAPQLFGDPITLPPSGAFNTDTLRTAFYGTFPPRRGVDSRRAAPHRIQCLFRLGRIAVNERRYRIASRWFALLAELVAKSKILR